MKISIQRSNLLTCVTCGYGIVDRKSAVPILSHLLLEANNNLLTVRGTDLDHTVVVKVAATVETSGSAVIRAETLYNIVKKCSDTSSISIEVNDQILTLQSGRSKFKLPVLLSNDFPNVPQVIPDNVMSISVEILRRLIDKVQFSMSSEETRYHLNGIFLHCTNESGLKAAATDGHRLAVTTAQLTEKNSFSGVILSKKTIYELRKLLNKPTEVVRVGLNDKQVQFDLEGETLIARLVEGTFPDYNKVVPKQSGSHFMVPRENFVEVVDRISVMSDNTVRAVKLDLNSRTLKISSIQSEFGTAQDEIEIEDYEGSEWSAGFNSKYLLDVAQNCSGEFLKIFATDSLSPTLIVDPSDPSTNFVIMPMRV